MMISKFLLRAARFTEHSAKAGQEVTGAADDVAKSTAAFCQRRATKLEERIASKPETSEPSVEKETYNAFVAITKAYVAAKAAKLSKDLASKE